MKNNMQIADGARIRLASRQRSAKLHPNKFDIAAVLQGDDSAMHSFQLAYTTEWNTMLLYWIICVYRVYDEQLACCFSQCPLRADCV